MNDNGILNKILSKWTKSPKVDCLNSDSSVTAQIDFKMVITAFVMLGSFFITAFVIVMLENMLIFVKHQKPRPFENSWKFSGSCASRSRSVSI